MSNQSQPEFSGSNAQRASSQSTPSGLASSSQSFWKGDMVWRFGGALAIMAAASWWAIGAESSDELAISKNPLSWKFWTSPVEWHSELRRPYLTGTFTSVEVLTDEHHQGWVYFGGQGGLVIRRELNGSKWDTLTLRHSDIPDDRANIADKSMNNTKNDKKD